MPHIKIKTLRIEDIPKLPAIDGSVESNSELHVKRIESDGKIHYILKEQSRAEPFILPPNYAFDEGDDRYFRFLIEEFDAWGLIVEDDEKAIGYCLCIEHRLDRTFFVESIYVDLNKRGRGHGSVMMNRIVEEARRRSLAAVWLKTESANIPACRFYECCGFRVIGVKENIGQVVDRSPWQAAVFWGKKLSWRVLTK